MIKLSLRLKALAEFVDDNSNIVDIGCDHGFLDIYLIQKKKNIKVIASDVNANALNNAKTNVKKYNLTDKILTVLSNGLDNIDTTCIDTIIIAGMGAHTAVGILYNNLKKIKNVDKLIIQSNNDLDFLRTKITKIGYYIKREKLVKDARKIYTVIEFKKGYKLYSKKKLYFGPCLLEEKNELFFEKYMSELEKIKAFYSMIPFRKIHYKIKTYLRIKMIEKILFVK